MDLTYALCVNNNNIKIILLFIPIFLSNKINYQADPPNIPPKASFAAIGSCVA